MPICLEEEKNAESYAVVDKTRERERERWIGRGKEKRLLSAPRRLSHLVLSGPAGGFHIIIHSHSLPSDWPVRQDSIVMSWNLLTRVAEPRHDNIPGLSRRTPRCSASDRHLTLKIVI